MTFAKIIFALSFVVSMNAMAIPWSEFDELPELKPRLTLREGIPTNCQTFLARPLLGETFHKWTGIPYSVNLTGKFNNLTPFYFDKLIFENVEWTEFRELDPIDSLARAVLQVPQEIIQPNEIELDAKNISVRTDSYGFGVIRSSYGEFRITSNLYITGARYWNWERAQFESMGLYESDSFGQGDKIALLTKNGYVFGEATGSTDGGELVVTTYEGKVVWIEEKDIVEVRNLSAKFIKHNYPIPNERVDQAFASWGKVRADQSLSVPEVVARVGGMSEDALNKFMAKLKNMPSNLAGIALLYGTDKKRTIFLDRWKINRMKADNKSLQLPGLTIAGDDIQSYYMVIDGKEPRRDNPWAF